MSDKVISSDQRFESKTIIITGAGGNFGREGCLYFASRGAKIVVALDNNSTALEETKEYVHSSFSENDLPKVVTFQCDVTNKESVEKVVESVCESYGVPHMLWNNAGYQGQIAPTLEYDIADFSRVMNINVVGLFIVLQAVSKKMAEERDESKNYAIVNTASVAALRGTPAMVAYSSSKAAVITMTVSSAKDLAPHGIRVNAISPALIGGYMWKRQNELHAECSSPYFANDPEKVAQGKIQGVPMKRLGSIEEVLKSVAYLLSEDSSYTTASNLVVDGGLSGGIH